MTTCATLKACLIALMLDLVVGLNALGHNGRTGSSPVPGTKAEDEDNRPTTYTDMLWDDFVQAQTEAWNGISAESDQANWEQYIEQLEWLHSHPMDINRATPEEMAALPFLTPAQIEALQAYVHLDGPMKSLGELALIPALDYQTRRVLPFFFYVDHHAPQTKGSWLRGLKYTADTRMDIPLYYRKGYQTKAYRGNPLYSRARYNMVGEHLSLGLRTKKDGGEEFLDSHGGYAQVKDWGLVRTAIVGDYRAGWGEGLVMGRGGFYSGDNMMNSPASGIRPMTGVMESGFLRGMAVTLGRAHKRHVALSGTVFASLLAQDATLDEAGHVRTLLTTGYHRTKTECEKRHNTQAATVGCHVQVDIGHWRLGATGYWQRFDRMLSPGSEGYRRWYPRGRDFGVVGVHGGYSHYRLTATGEVAYSTNHGGIAALGRATWLASRNLKLGILGRYYSHRFYSFHASAVATGSRVQNERGAMLRVEARPWQRLLLTSYIDLFADYWPRYGMTHSSSGQTLMAQGRWEATTRHTLSLRYQMKRRAAGDSIVPKHRLRLQWTYLPSARWRMQSTASLGLAAGHQAGFAFAQAANGKMLRRDALRLGVMARYFYAKDYDTRVYVYEPSLWNSALPSTMCYGHGMGVVCTVRYVFPHSHWMVEAKYALTHMLDGRHIGSGLQEILSPTRQDLSVQVRMTY